MSTRIPQRFRDQVEKIADDRCEYCLLSRRVSFYPHEVDHIVAVMEARRSSRTSSKPAFAATEIRGRIGFNRQRRESGVSIRSQTSEVGGSLSIGLPYHHSVDPSRGSNRASFEAEPPGSDLRALE